MAGTCEALTIEENMALAWKRGARRSFGFALTRSLRELFREKLQHPRTSGWRTAWPTAWACSPADSGRR